MYVRVVVYPSARKEIVTVIGQERLEIQVREPATNNAANRRVVELVAKEYQTLPNNVRIISGHHSSRKICSITDTI